jgi:ketosteroid isomerase-like protein
VKAAHPAPGTELTRLFADDPEAPARIKAAAAFFHPDLEFTVAGGVSEYRTGTGLAELIEAWRDWLKPWDAYWTEIEEFIPAGEDRVLVVLRDHGRLRGGDTEVEQLGSSLWTVRDGKIARIDFYPNREQGLAAVGLRQ